MSAFPESGRSDRQKSGEISVRFRPGADILNLYRYCTMALILARGYGPPRRSGQRVMRQFRRTYRDPSESRNR